MQDGKNLTDLLKDVELKCSCGGVIVLKDSQVEAFTLAVVDDVEERLSAQVFRAVGRWLLNRVFFILVTGSFATWLVAFFEEKT